MTTLDLINTPGQVLVDLINTPGLCPRGTNLIIGLSAQQWLGADARAARSLAQYWQREKELVLPARTGLHRALQSPGACGAAQPVLVPAQPQSSIGKFAKAFGVTKKATW